MSARIGWWALSPALLMAAVLAWHEVVRPRITPTMSQANPIALPVLAMPRLQAGTYAVQAGTLGIAVRNLLASEFDGTRGISGSVQIDAEGRPAKLTLSIDLLPLLGGSSDVWQADALFALRDAGLTSAKFVAERLVARDAKVPGTLAIDCEGTLALHGQARRIEVTLFLAGERRDRGRLHGRLSLDVRAFGLPRSWRYGVVPMEPVIAVSLAATLQRQNKGS